MKLLIAGGNLIEPTTGETGKFLIKNPAVVAENKSKEHFVIIYVEIKERFS